MHTKQHKILILGCTLGVLLISPNSAMAIDDYKTVMSDELEQAFIQQQKGLESYEKTLQEQAKQLESQEFYKTGQAIQKPTLSTNSGTSTQNKTRTNARYTNKNTLSPVGEKVFNSY